MGPSSTPNWSVRVRLWEGVLVASDDCLWGLCEGMEERGRADREKRTNLLQISIHSFDILTGQEKSLEKRRGGLVLFLRRRCYF